MEKLKYRNELIYVMKVYEIPLRFVKSFLIEDDISILIDSGTPGSGKKIMEWLKESGKDPLKIKYVIFTHTHIDHIGGASEISIPNVTFLVHPNGLKYVKEGKARKPIPRSVPTKIFFLFGKAMIEKELPGLQNVKSIDEVDLPDWIEIIYTPGHTDDSISILLKESREILVGDLLQGSNNGLKYPSIYEDASSLYKSVDSVKQLKPNMVYVSHGKSSRTFLV
ncbi:MBL fold metallo-hydrolase [Acidianus sp. RZ1]|uniref:MBL fold metallo-hydrolase n=1 Tax=Acidianus sp. RZ1 TaxID=1540082 RepID=UPI0020A370DC|nr:MBL fold metallo-hydrolase [Acidianus sp. RZ1]